MERIKINPFSCLISMFSDKVAIDDIEIVQNGMESITEKDYKEAKIKASEKKEILDSLPRINEIVNKLLNIKAKRARRLEIDPLEEKYGKINEKNPIVKQAMRMNDLEKERGDKD